MVPENQLRLKHLPICKITNTFLLFNMLGIVWNQYNLFSNNFNVSIFTHFEIIGKLHVSTAKILGESVSQKIQFQCECDMMNVNKQFGTTSYFHKPIDSKEGTSCYHTSILNSKICRYKCMFSSFLSRCIVYRIFLNENS